MGLLSTMFSSREHYLSNHINKLNRGNAFPVNNSISFNDIKYSLSNESWLISGGTDEERSMCIMAALKCINGTSAFFLNNGNRYLAVENLKRSGINAVMWDDNIYKSMPKAQMLSMLIGDGEKNDLDLAFFYAYAFEVCEVLGIPLSLQGMASIDWLSAKWQQDLLLKGNERERVMDLLMRFDKEMAERAIRAVCRLERLTRVYRGQGSSVDEAIMNRTILVKESYGNQTSINRKCLEVIDAEAQKGREFTLILDNVYHSDISVIKENYRNARIIIAGSDLNSLVQNLYLTERPCNIIAFRHNNYASARAVSETFFGEYDKLLNDINSGYSKAMLQTTNNRSLTIRQGRELRLKPEVVANLQLGSAFIRTLDGLEGRLDLVQGGRQNVQKRSY